MPTPDRRPDATARHAAGGWRSTLCRGAPWRRTAVDLIAAAGMVALAAAMSWLCGADLSRTLVTAVAIAALIGLVGLVRQRIAQSKANLHALQASEQRFRDYSETDAVQAANAVVAAKQAAEQAQREAAAARGRLAAAIEMMPEGFVLFDPDDRMVICNSQFRSLYPRNGQLVQPGMRFEEILRMGAGSGQFLHAAGRVEAWIAERMAQHAAPSAEFEQHVADGRWIRVQERRLADGSSVGLRIDISELKRGQAAFRLSEERFRDFARTSSDWFWEQDAELRFTYFSDVSNTPRRFAQLIGKTRHDAIERGVTPERWAAHAADLAAHRPFRDFTYQRVNPDGEVRHISISGTPLFDEDGAFHGYRGTGRDITAEVGVAQALRQAKEEAESASRTKSQFLANMSHELRTPLNAILGFSEVIRDMMMGPVDARYRDYANDINRAGQHLLSLIGDVLDLSKIEVGRLELHDEPIALGELFESCRRLIAERAREQGVVLEVSVAGDLPALRGDRLRMKQILLNLLSNAVKFTPAGGRVALAATLQPDGELVVSVADSGIGMRAEDLPLALMPFGQVDGALSRRYEGTGLGLPLAKTLAELHGGRLEIDSAPNRGTLVRVTLPASRVLRAAA